ncbi:MAG TPA: glycosyltransferase [Thermoflexia bacterium]|nr:glycosyltransferase [Thermoflexia bacterium]
MSSVNVWRKREERYRLLGTECPRCGRRFVSPRLVCPFCRAEIAALAEEVFPQVAPPADTGTVVASVIVPSYNAAATIRGTLASLAAQEIDRPYEVIVVDSSDDGTDRIVAEEFPWVRLIRRDRQTDPGTARNLGIAQAAGEVIACLDADCVAPRDWLRRMLAAQREGHQVVGGAVENGNPHSLLAWAGYMGEFREFLPVGKPRTVRHVPTCNIAYHRSVFERFGGFPTRFYPQEDLLFHWRLSHHGVVIWFDPSIRVRHHHRARLGPYLAHQRRIGRITARVLRLTGEEGAFLARSPLLALGASPLLPLVKWGRTLGVFWSQAPEVLRTRLLALPLLLLGLCAWALGFVEGAWGPPLHWVDGEGLTWQRV